VAPEIAATLFEPYVRGAETRVVGLGLGLATVKRLAVAHGGTVGHGKRPGGGSTFWFELPAARGEDAPPARS
jgi:signal transduction histidine kinase